jgi:hypothetical protein
MKTPRLTDFDPNAKERKLSSPLDGMPIIGKPQPIPHSPTAQAHKDTEPHTTGTTVPRYHGTTVPVPKREIKRRHPFDVYKDQVKALEKLALEEKLEGGIGSQSAMVREALDDWLQKRKSSK